LAENPTTSSGSRQDSRNLIPGICARRGFRHQNTPIEKYYREINPATYFKGFR